MSSMGVFRKVEMDEKPFLVYTLTQTVDFDGGDFPLPPSFLCPLARVRFQRLRIVEEDGDIHWGETVIVDDVVHKEFLPFDSSPHFPSTRRGGESLLDCNDPDICKLPVVPIFWCNQKEPDIDEFECGVCKLLTHSVSYYACLECEKMFHKECVESPLEIKHPNHPFHSLKLRTPAKPRGNWNFCTSCGKELFNMSYDCPTSEVCMHPACAMKPIPLVVDHPKSHSHPLTFFPTQDSLVCHICSLIQKLDPTYICIQCVFVIHKDCIGFPHVIRISRHHHRLSFTSSLPLETLSCGVCRRQVDNKYGAYSCNKCDAYFVHSKCALNAKVWDGKELEEVPEEDDMIDDDEPFERIADGIILHPFHSHNLRLEIFIAYDENKYCQGCAWNLPIYEGQFYSCMECDFILHESCANAPRMIRHPLNPQPLTLCKVLDGINPSVYLCDACRRVIVGFHYVYYSSELERNFSLDLRCASIIEPFEYQGHKHPLFLPWDPEEMTRCQMCKENTEDFMLICLECDYAICFCCATLPYKVRYKHDSHFLMICDGKRASDQPDWCEICEGKIQQVKQRESWLDYKSEWQFYKCNDCCTTLHVECLLGVDIYMKSCKNIYYFTTLTDIQILLNSSLSRPICKRCKRRCPFLVYFKLQFRDFCTWQCTVR